MLDNISFIQRFDKSQMLKSIELLYKQVEFFSSQPDLKLPASYSQINKIALIGMGGSGLGGEFVRTVFKDKLKIPLIIINDYNIPAWINKNTLVILSSYSGNTEEVLTAAGLAIKKTQKIAGITTGSRLGFWLKRNQKPALIIPQKFNPCNQPRMSLGYSALALSKLGLIKVAKKEIREIIKLLNKLNKELSAEVSVNKNQAKQLAQSLKNKIPVIIASEHLQANAHILANQINENAKNFSCYFTLPELNHHLMEGLSFPNNLKTSLCFVFLESVLYFKRNQRRYRLTQELLDKKKVSYFIFQPQSREALLQAFEALSFGSYVSFYLSILNKLDPSLIPVVDWFKKKL